MKGGGGVAQVMLKMSERRVQLPSSGGTGSRTDARRGGGYFDTQSVGFLIEI